MVYILIHRKHITARQLAEQLNVSMRTIYRYIDILSAAGIPIYTEHGHHGGIRIMAESVLSQSALSEQEQNEILTALHGLAHLKASEKNNILNKLSTMFNKTAVNWLEVDFSDWSYANHYFEDFKTAILECRIAEFDYFNSYGEKTFRRIEPIQLLFKSRAWYLKGYCLTKEGVRLYKLTRVKNLRITHERFIPRTHPEDTSFESTNKENYVTIKMRISPEMKYRIFDDFDETDVKQQPDGSFIITVHWAEDNWVYGYILSFGEYAEVLEPAHIRELIKAKGLKISEKYP